MKKPVYSLKKQLLLWVSLPVLLAGILVALLAFVFSWKEIEEVYDAQLVHSAKVLLQITEHEILESGGASIQLGAENKNLQHHYENKTGFRIWYKDQLVTHSANADLFENIQASPGFSDQRVKDKPWRFFVFIDSVNNLKIETSERYAIRYELIGQLMTSLIIPALLFVPIILIAIWVGARKSLKPLIRLSRAVDERHSDDLTPIQDMRVPAEVLPLVQAMNRLFARISDSFRREREFTDNAAHELRTPLAAMKTQTQVLMKKAAQMPDCRDGLDNLNSSIDRSTHLVEQLLSFARLQNESLVFEEMNLSECMHDVIQECLPTAQMKAQDVQVSITDDVIIKGHHDSIAIMIRNFIDNAIKYTPEKGALSISLLPNGAIQITDTGPGLSDEDKIRVFARFVRADKTNQTGSGLGLSIAQWIADGHGAKIVLTDNVPHGLIVSITWKTT